MPNVPAGTWVKRIAAHYAAVHTCGKEQVAIMAIDLTDWARTIEKIAEGLHDGTLSTTDLSERFIRDTYGELAGGAREGYGKEWSKPDPGTGTIPDDVRAMQQNVWRFSVSKDFAVQVALSEALTRNGQVTPYADFKAYALKLNKEYNETHLRTEYLTARQGANMAAQWQTYQDGKEQFPNLKYRTQEDDRVREEHQSLAGKVAAVDDPFWDTFYPPNGWRCRCYVAQTAEAVSSSLPAVKDVPGMKEQFVGNVGKSGQLFNEGIAKGAKEHPYFSLAKDKGGPELREQLELSKRYAPVVELHRAGNGATVTESIWAQKEDAPRNISAAKVVADGPGISSKVLAHVNIDGVKNPEYEFDGSLKGDRVSPTSENVKGATSNAFRDKLGKGGQLNEEKEAALLIEVWFDDKGTNVNQFTSQAWSKYKSYENLQKLILTRGNKAVEINRAALTEGFDAFDQKVRELF